MTVSLSSILSSYGYGTTKTDSSAASTAISTALQKLAQQAEQKSAASTSGTQVTISAEALAAAAAQSDNEKDATVLAQEVRAALDSQYAAGTRKGDADFSGLSGRALALVALDKDGQFSPAESRAAKEALREDTRLGFVAAMGGGGLSAMASFSQQLATQYDAMSPEERDARGWTEQFRNTSADFAQSTDIPSLFDQL